MVTTTARPTVRDRLLDAAVEVAAVRGLARLSMGDVAKQAGVSRQTLYKHFRSRDQLVDEAVLREAGAIVDRVVDAADAVADPGASLEAAIITTLRLSREHPLLDRLVRTEPEALLPLLVGEQGPVAGAVRAVIEQIIERRLPGHTPLEVRQVADMLGRLLVSYAVSAPDDPPEVVARFLATVVTHGLADDTATAPTAAPAADG